MKTKEIIDKMSHIKQKSEELDSKYNKLKSMLQKRFDKNSDNKKFDGTIHSANLVEKIKINYHIEKLKESLDKEIINEILDKEYTISNMKKLIKLCKSYKVPSKELKKCIEVKEQVNAKKISHLFDIGEITLESIKDCYDSSIVKYIQLRKRSDSD